TFICPSSFMVDLSAPIICPMRHLAVKQNIVGNSSSGRLSKRNIVVSYRTYFVFRFINSKHKFFLVTQEQVHTCISQLVHSGLVAVDIAVRGGVNKPLSKKESECQSSRYFSKA